MDYDTLIISCGGMKGCSAISFLQTINPYISFTHIKNYYGSSIGGLIVSLIAIGYSIDEIYQIFYYLQFSNFQEFHIKQMLECSGLDNGDKYNRLLISIFQYKHISPHMTLQELYDRTGIYLYLTGTNLSRRSSVSFSHRTHPRMSIIMAIRITTCIPFLYVPIEYEGDMYIDGGLLEPMPKNILNNARALAILLQEIPDRFVNVSRKSANREINIIEYGMMIFNLYFTNQLRHTLENFCGDLVEIHIDDHHIFEFELSREHKKTLFHRGKELGEKFIDDWIIKNYRRKIIKKYFLHWRNATNKNANSD